MNRSDILREANRLITGDRAQTYGDARESFERIGQLWSALFGVEFTGSDVALALAILKIHRAKSGPEHLDSWIDLAGYSALGGEIAGAGAAEVVDTVVVDVEAANSDA